MTANGKRLFKSAMAEYLKWHAGSRKNTKMRFHAASSLEYFGDMRLGSISRDAVREWIKTLEPRYSSKTISHQVAAARQMFTYLELENRWNGKNPFEKHEWRGKKSQRKIKPTVSPAEFQDIASTLRSKQGRQAVMIGYYTGLRPTEICGIEETDIRHDKLMMHVTPAKDRDLEPEQRWIAIPRALSLWILNTGFVPMNYFSVCNALTRHAKRNPEYTGLCLESFRDNFAIMLRLAGVPRDVVDVHQGRATNVQDTHYTADDPMFAVNLMRDHLNAVFVPKPSLSISGG